MNAWAASRVRRGTVAAAAGLLTVLVAAAASRNVRPAAAAPGVGAAAGGVQLMIVGIAHLVRRRDVHNNVFPDSPLSPKRQEQIAAVIDHLARFRPTKVLVEAPMGDSSYVHQYRDFLAGRYQLGPDEVYQFGFRLAARAGDSTIYPINTFGPSLINETTDSGKRMVAFLDAQMVGVSTPAFAVLLAREDTLERHGTYLDLLRYLNTDAAIRANASVYSVLDGMGRDVDDAGAAYVSQWYARNCYIFSNILSVLRPGDRAVVIIGQGHEYLLRELARLNPTLTDVDPLTYLK